MLDRHKKFVEEYLIDGNGARAYLRVYPNATEKSAKELASGLLKRQDISAELTRLQEERMKQVMWSAEDILQQIKDIALDPTTDTPQKLKALELGAKSLGMFRDKVEHSGAVSIVLDQSLEEWAE
jgi:phage terminase small subunit